MDFTRDDMAQHFQDLLPPQLLATSASQLIVGICLHVCVHIRGRFLTFLLYGQSRLEKMTIYLKMDNYLGGKKARSERLHCDDRVRHESLTDGHLLAQSILLELFWFYVCG